MSLNWYRHMPNGERTKIEPNSLKYILSLFRRRLIIKSPNFEDGGVYECEAEFTRPGDASFPPVSAKANLTVQGKN